jgi:hypothetical protein
MQTGIYLVVHFVELVDHAETLVRQHQSACNTENQHDEIWPSTSDTQHDNPKAGTAPTPNTNTNKAKSR